MNKPMMIAVLCATMTGCATTQGIGAGYNPVVDTQGVDMNRYAVDLQQCKLYAEQVSPMQNAGNAAVAGALFGALLGVASGGNRRYNNNLAGVGAVSAGAGAAAGSLQKQQAIIMRCLAGRGYNVLGQTETKFEVLALLY